MDRFEVREAAQPLLEGTGGAPQPADSFTEPAAQAKPFKSYEELDGASGRAVFFRPHRFTAGDLAPLRGTVSVDVDGVVRECALRDVSQNGVAFEWAANAEVRRGQLVALAVRFDGHAVWHGNARVTSMREHDHVVGASLEDQLLDTDEILQLREVAGWAAENELGTKARGWHAPGNHAFKAALGDFRLFLDDAKEKLDEIEKWLPWHVLQDPASPARAALIRKLRADFGADVLGFIAQIDGAMRGVDPASAAAMKAYSRRQVQDVVLATPWMNRAYSKPFGYPGDYELMNFFYEKDFEGSSLFTRAFGHAFLQTPVACAVRFRKDLVRRQLRAILDQRAGSSRPVRFLSIAAGPAREIQELLAEVDELPAPLEIVLFDQDKGALAHAYKRLRPIADARHPGRVRVVFLNESIKRLLRDVHLFDEFDGFDAVYSCGLFDYLQEFTAIRLARNLSAAARPGAPVLIANMVDHASRWIMEYHLDWELLYRTRDELLSIGRRAAPQARIRLLEEESGVNPFIEIVRS